MDREHRVSKGLRVPKVLVSYIEQEAKKNRRNFSSQVIYMIEQQIEKEGKGVSA